MRGTNGFAALLVLFWMPGAGLAGDRLDVLDVLNDLEGNWPEARLRAHVEGMNDDQEVELGQTIRYAFQSELDGLAYLLHVSSHGEMTWLASGASFGRHGESDAFTVAPPLGAESVYLVLSNRFPAGLLPPGEDLVALGDSGEDARWFAEKLLALDEDFRWTVQRLDYEIVAQHGATQYTSRGIVRQLEEAESMRPPGGSVGSGVAGAGPEPFPPSGSGFAFPTKIEFEFDSDQLTDQGRLDVDVFGEVMRRERWLQYDIELEGHTDDVGDPGYNHELSRRRAETVRAYLVHSFGIGPERLRVAPYGETRPRAPNDSAPNRALNRRVEFVFHHGSQ